MSVFTNECLELLERIENALHGRDSVEGKERVLEFLTEEAIGTAPPLVRPLWQAGPLALEPHAQRDKLNAEKDWQRRTHRGG